MYSQFIAQFKDNQTNCGFSVDCKVGQWNAWGICSVTCGGGTKTKTRDVIQEPKYGGMTCPVLEETMICNTYNCEGTLFVFLFFLSQFDAEFKV